MKKTRCAWAETNDLFISYHDNQWGVPVHDDRMLFEMLSLEGAQAGLSWLTILKKYDNYLAAFDNFNAKTIVKYSDKKRMSLMNDSGIVRNRLKINAVIENAKAFLSVVNEFGSFDKYIWGFVKYKTLLQKQNKEAALISEIMSKDLKKRGFRFVGPTICYAYMESVGMINNHSPECYLFKSM